MSWRKCLREKGFDLHSNIFDTKIYNDFINKTSSALPLLPPCRAILIGNTRHLWPIFKAHIERQRSLGRVSSQNPLDEYVRESFASCFPALKDRIRFSDDVGDRFIHIQKIASLSGLAFLDKTVNYQISLI
jgi:hypothetical protein